MRTCLRLGCFLSIGFVTLASCAKPGTEGHKLTRTTTNIEESSEAAKQVEKQLAKEAEQYNSRFSNDVEAMKQSALRSNVVLCGKVKRIKYYSYPSSAGETLSRFKLLGVLVQLQHVQGDSYGLVSVEDFSTSRGSDLKLVERKAVPGDTVRIFFRVTTPLEDSDEWMPEEQLSSGDFFWACLDRLTQRESDMVFETEDGYATIWTEGFYAQSMARWMVTR